MHLLFGFFFYSSLNHDLMRMVNDALLNVLVITDESDVLRLLVLDSDNPGTVP